MQQDDGNVHNFLGYDRSFLDGVGSHDSLGRVLWATGYTQVARTSQDFKAAAKEVFDKALVWAMRSSSSRTQAYAILGLHHYAEAFPDDRNPPLNIVTLADRLCESYRRESDKSWRWFEPCCTYANARLPQALFRAYQTTGKEEYLTIAKNALDFLAQMDIVEGVFQPVGNRVWYARGEERELYDQQPIEASCMVQAAITALHVTQQNKYLQMALTSFDWFMGRNSKGVVVYNPATGGCYDGITSEGLNRNQGAEAGLAFLLARLEMENLSTSAP
ncbi:glycosyltransferase [Candidatus Thorarchaeota archaeon]|nr:MAG: glycosyltransferase [Candidatus Thorarchaeota archaeon]